MSHPAFLTEFAHPPNTFRPWPFLVLNDEYLPGRGEGRITELLENLARVGFGGIFIHPRPGLITEYLSPRWFEVVRHCLTECRRLGLVAALYDENSYPSGFGGGHVPALAPQTNVRYLLPKFGRMPARPPAEALSVHRAKDGAPTGRVDPLELAESDEWCAFVIERMAPMSWHGEFPYVSLLEPTTTKTFLETTHQRYRDELGEEDWKSCAAIFTDEPHLVSDSHGPWGQGLQFSRLVQAEFRHRRGYAIENVLADLYFDSPTSAATRFDYYETVHALWLENFALPLHTWCRENGIPLTGHYLEHDWPCPYATPGHIHLLAHLDWPGTDLLECFALEGHDYPDPQNLDPAAPGTEPHALYFLKQVQSVANQLGKPRVMNESWGAGGHDSTPVDWLRIGRFLAVHGVNLFVPHYSPTTIRGARKKDHPQFFSEHSPWFDDLGPINAELGRLAWLVGQGTTQQRVLVLDPLTTGYCLAAKSDCLNPASLQNAVVDPLTFIADTQRTMRPLRQSTGAFAQALSDAQVDFDIGDEYVLAEFGGVSAPGLRIGEQTYDLLVLPPGLQNLRADTFTMLQEFARNGGEIVGVQPALAWLDGRPSDWPAQLPVRWMDSPDALVQTIRASVPPRLKFTTPPPAGIAHQRRVGAAGTFYLIVNSSPTDWSTICAVPETTTARLLNPRSGEMFAFDGRLELASGEAAVIFCPTESPTSELPSPPRISAAPISSGAVAEFLHAERLHPNVLAVDYCALEVHGETFPPQLVYETNRIYWEKHGLDTNGWTGVIQYRDHLLAANGRMRPDSGGAVHYPVVIDPGVALDTVDVAFECPGQWRLEVNGRPVETGDFSPWLDEHIARVHVGPFLHEGRNTITLLARPFDVRQEIDQIYLLGDFATQPADPGFRLVPENAALRLGSWRAQGLPFFDRKITYHFRRPPGTTGLELSPDSWRGSVIEFACGDRRVSGYGPGLRCAFHPTDPLEFTLTVTGLPINLLGPWHKPNLLPKHGWANFWHGGDVPNAPQPGVNYHQLDLGLFAAPILHP